MGARREIRAARECCVFAEASVRADREEKEAFKRNHALQWGKLLGFCSEKSAAALVVGGWGRVQALITWS